MRSITLLASVAATLSNRRTKIVRCSCLASFVKSTTTTKGRISQKYPLHSSPSSIHHGAYFSTTSKNSRRNRTTSKSLEQQNKTARELLDEGLHSRGSFTLEHFEQANSILTLYKRERVTDPESVNLSIALIERLVAEVATSKDEEQQKCICEPIFFRFHLTLWKEAAMRQDGNVISPQDLLEKLQSMSKQLPEFRFDIVILNVIMDVAIKQAPPQKAPMIAEYFLELSQSIHKEASDQQREELHPSVVTYSNVIQAWALSGLPQASVKIDELFETMRKEDIAPTEVTYTSILRYWSGKGAVDKTEAILEEMKAAGLAPSRTSLSSAIYCYSRSGNFEKAEEILEQMTKLEARDKREVNMPAESIQNILLAYRRVLNDPNTDSLQKEKAAECAKALFEKLSESTQLTDENQTMLTNTIMDVLARAGKPKKVEKLLEKGKIDAISLNLLMKAYGKADMADKATSRLKEMLGDSRVNPDIQTFNTLLNTWADSSMRHAVDQAFMVLRLMNEDPKCIVLGIRPNTITFNSLLKCLSKSERKDAGRKAVEVLNEMERRYKAGESNTRPNDITIKVAIKTCLKAGDAKNAELLLSRLEQLASPLDIAIYNEILQGHWAEAGAIAASKHTVRILECMTELIMYKKPALHRTVYSYNIIMNAWHKSGHPDSRERMWMLYQQLKFEENLQPDISSFNILISSLAKSKKRHLIERADTLLQHMERSKLTNIAPDHRHFIPVIKGWLSINDVLNATRVLKWIATSFNDSEVKLNIIMDIVMRGWIKVGSLEQATLLVNEMQDLKDANRLSTGPDFDTYRCLIDAWKRSKHPEKWDNARKLNDRFAVLKSAANAA